MDPTILRHARASLTTAVQRSRRWLDTRGLPGLRRARRRGLVLTRRAIRALPRPDPKALARIQPATAVVLALGGIVAAGGYLAINEYAIDRLQREYGRAAGEVSSILTKAIDRHVALAESAAPLFSGPRPNVNRWAFFKFVRPLPAKHPGLAAVAWVPRVSERQRRRFERRARADGLFDFRFVERGPDGARVKAGRRPEYYPVYYVEPYPGNEAMLGLDLAADAKVADFLASVRDTGKTLAAPATPMPSGDAELPGFSVVLPVYRSSAAPFTAAERRKALSGFIRADFRFDRLFESLREGLGGLPALEIYVLDRAQADKPSLVHFFSSRPGDGADGPASVENAYEGLFFAVDHEAAGRQWTIVVKPVLSVFQSILRFTAWGFVAFTALLTALLLRHLATMRLGRERAEAANRAKSEFLAMMSHELRTPLNSVIGFSDVMINELFGPLNNDHYKEYIGHINRSATHLLGLINSILDISKVEAGYYKLEKQTFTLGELWESVLPILQGGLRGADVEIDDNLSGSPLALHADARVLRQILINLVGNAIKFTPRGGRVTVTADVGDDRRLTLRVTDTGIGIAENDIDLVLKPFRQVDNSLSRKYEGVGLGLPLTRGLVELHGGKLRIDSRLDEGTEVSAVFPEDILVAEDTSHDTAPPPPRDDPSAGRDGAVAESDVAALRG